MQWGNSLRVGAVLTLQDVTVFNPTPFAHFLNILGGTISGAVKTYIERICNAEITFSYLFLGKIISLLSIPTRPFQFIEIISPETKAPNLSDAEKLFLKSMPVMASTSSDISIL